MPIISKYGIENHGLVNLGSVHWNLHTAVLYEEIVRRREGFIAHLGPVITRTGHHTARAAHDKFIVKVPGSESEKKVWWGKVNRPFDPAKFDLLYLRLQAYVQGRDLFVQDCWAGADPRYRIPIRVITERAWHSLLARNMFKLATNEELKVHTPQFTVLCLPSFHAIPEVDGTRSEVFILLNLEKKLVVIGGTAYAGEIKKSVFTYLNYILPQQGILAMHCSANIGERGDTAIFFGLSGTGKTTLSADPHRRLIGDDEHGWSEHGVFNFEGGCYAKVIKVKKETEPEIWECTRKFGTILENVIYDPETRRLNLDDSSLTENTRAAYPITHIPTAVAEGMGGHPENIIMLTADAFGVMPPISRLTPEQAMYHFLSGYTSKLGGTEAGIGSEPKAVFSACFGAPFMALHPTAYADLLREKIKKHNVKCWLVNTGWTGGPYGVGERMKLPYTRAMVKAALNGELDNVEYETEPFFGLSIPKSCPDVPSEVLNPKNTWKDKKGYDEKASKLAAAFLENFKEFEDECDKEIISSGPRR